MSPNLLRSRLGGSDHALVSPDFWLELIRVMVDQGHRVELFSNGARRDRIFLRSLAGLIAGSSLGQMASLLPAAANGRELTAQIAKMRAVIGFRLHANVLAFALGVPSVPLVWDEKVRHFAAAAGIPAIELTDLDPRTIALHLSRTLENEPDDSALQRLKSTVRDDVDAALSKCGVP
jgi:polysaccharide pyruvyl transferase WcaK-like protein